MPSSPPAVLSRLRGPCRGSLIGNLRGASTAALIGLPTELIYGLIAVAPLGAAHQSAGVIAALGACILAAFVTPLAGGHVGQIPGSRPALALIVAALLTELLARWNGWFGVAPQAADLLTITFATVALAGLLQIAFGLLRLGQLVKYLPSPVLSGITNGVAILILLQAIRPLLGIPREVAWSAFPDLWQAFKPLSLALGLMAAGLYIFPPDRLRKLPPIVIAMTGCTIAYYLLLGLAGPNHLGPDFGTIPSSLPTFAGFALTAGQRDAPLAEIFGVVLPYAITIAALGSLESLLSAAAVDSVGQSRHESNRELVAQGVANVAAGLFGGTPVAATIPRSLANVRAGATSGVACLVYGTIIAGTLLLVPHWLGAVPQVATAGILVGVAWQMIDPWSRGTMRKLLLERARLPAASRRVLAANGLVMIGVSVATLVFGLVWALAFGVVLTTLFFLRSNQKDVIRARMNGFERRSLRVRTPEQTQFLDALAADIVIIETQGALFFGSADKLAGEIERCSEHGDFVVLDLARVSYIDATAARVLELVQRRLKSRGKKFYLSGLNPLDAQRSEIVTLLDDVGLMPSAWFIDLDSALEQVEEEILAIRFDPADRWRRHELAETTLGTGLDEDELVVLRRHLKERAVQAQEVVYRESDAGNSLFVLVRGAASLYLTVGNGHSMRLTAFSAGTVFGSLTIPETKPRTHTAVADVESTLLELDADRLHAICLEHPALAAKIYRNLGSVLAERLSHALDSLRATSGS